MDISILGTGLVAQTLARRWAAANHRIVFGSGDPFSKVGSKFLLCHLKLQSRITTLW